MSLTEPFWSILSIIRVTDTMDDRTLGTYETFPEVVNPVYRSLPEELHDVLGA